MTWITRTVLIPKPPTETHGISTIDDELRFVSVFARTILALFKTHDLYAILSKIINDQRFSF